MVVAMVYVASTVEDLARICLFLAWVWRFQDSISRFSPHVIHLKRYENIISGVMLYQSVEEDRAGGCYFHSFLRSTPQLYILLTPGIYSTFHLPS